MKTKVLKAEEIALQKKFEKFDENLKGEKPALGLLKLDPSLFAYFFFKDLKGDKFKVYPFQDLILNDRSRRIVVCISRQSGKSTMAAILAFWSAFFNNNFTVIVVSATKPQSVELIYKLKNILNTSKGVDWYTVAMAAGKESKSEIVLKNHKKKTKSRIISVPATDAARGYTADLVIVDEAAFIENGDYIFNQVVEPMTQYTKGQILLLSTPNGKQGFFWNAFNSEFWSSYQFNWRVCPNNTEEEMVDKKKRMTAMEFQAEYEALFVAAKSAYFNPFDVESAVDKNWVKEIPDQESSYCVGVDFGKIRDHCLIVVGKVTNPGDPIYEQIIKVVDRIVKPLGTNYASIMGELKALNQRYHGPYFVFDATGVGEAPSDVLAKEGLRIDPVKFSIQSKANIFSNLKIFFEQKRIRIPNEVELINQLQLFQYEYTISGQIKLHHPEGGHDDECDALALMVWGLSAKYKPCGISFIKPSKDKKNVGGLKDMTHLCVKCTESFRAPAKKHFRPNMVCPACE